MIPSIIVAAAWHMIPDRSVTSTGTPLKLPVSPDAIVRDAGAELANSARKGLAASRAQLADLLQRNDGVDWSENIAFCKRMIKFWEGKLAECENLAASP